jgi:hypothetical protein
MPRRRPLACVTWLRRRVRGKEEDEAWSGGDRRQQRRSGSRGRHRRRAPVSCCCCRAAGAIRDAIRIKKRWPEEPPSTYWRVKRRF